MRGGWPEAGPGEEMTGGAGPVQRGGPDWGTEPALDETPKGDGGGTEVAGEEVGTARPSSANEGWRSCPYSPRALAAARASKAECALSHLARRSGLVVSR